MRRLLSVISSADGFLLAVCNVPALVECSVSDAILRAGMCQMLCMRFLLIGILR